MRGWTALLNVRLLRQFFGRARRYSYAIFHCGVLWAYVGKYHRFQYTNGDTTAGEATDAAAVNSVACPIIRSPTIRYVSTQTLLNSFYKNAPMRPNKPMILPKTSTMRIFTNKSGSAASASAAVEPAIPTEIPQRRLHTPTVRPPQNSANPGLAAKRDHASGA